MRSLRNSPLALAAAAIIAAPGASAQPLSLSPPANTETTQAAPQAQPQTQSQTGTPTSQPAEQPAELRGPVGPVPDDLSLTPVHEAPPPPAPPPVQEAAAEPAPQTQAQAPAPQPQEPRLAPAPTATVTVGRTDDYTRLAFRFPGPTNVTPTLQGNRLELRFSRAADIDLAEIRSSLPRFVRDVRRLSGVGAPVRLALTLDAGVRQRSFTDGDRVVVDLLPPENGDATGAVTENGQSAPIPARAPVNGVGRVRLVEEASVTRITVTWPSPARAAAFRRGEAIWLVFDAAGRMDLTGVARAGRRHQNIEIVQGEGVIGLRIPAAPDVLVSASADENNWTITLGARAETHANANLIREIAGDGRARLIAQFTRDGAVRWIRDPEIGDRIAVGLIGGPAKGIDARRATIEAALLPTAHGAVIEPRADGVTAAFNGGNLIVARGDDGLIAGGEQQQANAANSTAALLEAAMNAGAEDAAVTEAETGMTLVQVRERIDALTRRAALEGVEAGAPVQARMELARFLLQHEFAAEALGALRIVAINQGEMVETDPEFRLMRGAANVMMGRERDAAADLSASPLMDNTAAALWRGYAAAERQEWGEARRELARGSGALETMPPSWRARFQLALARAALELNDHAAAEAATSAALGQAATQSLRLQAVLLQARLAYAREDRVRALQLLDELSRASDEEVAVQASVESIRMRRLNGELPAADAVEPLEALRFRWRGDSTELAVVGMLGDVYSELGRWREAMATMRIASDRFPTDPASRQLRADMVNLFERLFLDGEADELQPIQALGLFYEFSDITPVGPNGDRIVRLLAGRLVHVDLLEQAAQLLQHQVDERLQGLSKAQVAADLAAIYLMDRKPDQALTVLANSRQPNMPQTLLADRRILEARALLELGRLDGAVELVERDRSENAQRVRAEAAWRARDWERAASEMRTLLSLRNRAQPLDVHGRQAVLRTGVALTLAGDEAGVRQLYRDYAGDMANTEEAAAFEVVASGVSADGAAIRDVARAVARTDLLDRFMQTLRSRMTENAQGEARTQAQATTPTTPTPPTPTG